MRKRNPTLFIVIHKNITADYKSVYVVNFWGHMLGSMLTQMQSAKVIFSIFGPIDRFLTPNCPHENSESVKFSRGRPFLAKTNGQSIPISNFLSLLTF